MLDDLEAATERDRLLKLLDARQHDIGVLHDYYDGKHSQPRLPESCASSVKDLRDHALLNLCPLVVNAVDERLTVQGFQFGDGSGSGVDVWNEIWQPNQLDAVAPMVMQEALIARRSFVLVWLEGDQVVITPETPDEVLVDYHPGSRRRRRSAVKRFVSGSGKNKVVDVTMWTDEAVWRWQSTGSSKVLVLDEGGTGLHPFGQVPVVEFLSLPDLRGVPHSELDRGVIAIQDRINKTIFDRLVLQEFQAFPQRWATGLEVELDAAGNPIRPFGVGPNKVVTNEDSEAKFGQWDAADLSPHLAAVDADVHAMAAVSKTPVHYLAAQFSNVSADAIRAAEAGLVMKVRGHQRSFGESWEEVVRLALVPAGDPRSTDMASLVEWADPESRTEAEEADAAIKLAPLLPKDETWRRLGYSPQERTAMATAMMEQALTDRVGRPTVEVVSSGG